jgi:hypothetical protein
MAAGDHAAICYAKLARIFWRSRGRWRQSGVSSASSRRKTGSRTPSCVGTRKHSLEWARSGHKITNRKLAAFWTFDPVADWERIEQHGLNLSTGPKGGRSGRGRGARWSGRSSRRRSIAAKVRRVFEILRLHLRNEVVPRVDRPRMRFWGSSGPSCGPGTARLRRWNSLRSGCAAKKCARLRQARHLAHPGRSRGALIGRRHYKAIHMR